MGNPFAKASKESGTLARVLMAGPSGTGKTYSALQVASALGKVALIDTEFGSAKKYGDKFNFDCVELYGGYTTEALIENINAAVENKYSALIIDSFSHFWEGDGGILEFVDIEKAGEAKNNMNAWGKASPKWRQQIAAMLRAPIHLIVTCRTKNAVEATNVNGRMQVKSVGTKVVQREGFEYELDLVANFRIEDGLNLCHIEKTRCSDLHGQTFKNLNSDHLLPYFKWLGIISETK
jgi:hypothetical protein